MKHGHAARHSNDINEPHITIERDDTVHGIGNTDTTIVRVNTTVADGRRKSVDGVLPDELITNTPHIRTPKQTRCSDNDVRIRYIPLQDAPRWYKNRIENEFSGEWWVVRANKYYEQSAAGEIEAIVMALCETLDTIGAGQTAAISDVTGWSENRVNEIISDLQTTKYDSYRRETTTIPETQ